MLMMLSQLRGLPKIDKVVIHSLDLSLYQASIFLDGEEYYIADNKGKFLRAFNILDLQKHFKGLKYDEMVVRHQSAYDEMIGQPGKESDTNVLEVPFKDNGLYGN